MLLQKVILPLILTLVISSCSSRLRTQQIRANTGERKLSQNYTNVYKDDICGLGPAVRFIDFTFDKSDSLEISIDITTSIGEKKISGQIAIVVDEYELIYANKAVSKMYTETVETDIQNRYPYYVRGRQSLISAIIRSSSPKGSRKIAEKQYWNTVKVNINPEDYSLIQNSSHLRFIVFTPTCELEIRPNSEQIEDLQLFLSNH